MDLWIKSQNQNMLRKIDNVFINDDNSIDICTYCGDDAFHLGEYSTKERALEVLDEIQKLLMGQDKLVISGVLDFEDAQQIKKKLDQTGVVSVFSKDDIGYITPSTIVYEMPLE